VERRRTNPVAREDSTTRQTNSNQQSDSIALLVGVLFWGGARVAAVRLAVRHGWFDRGQSRSGVDGAVPDQLEEAAISGKLKSRT